jgi:ATP-dependent helicase/nuclease subunit A
MIDVMTIDEAVRLGKSLVISAGAGTGKTHQLTNRYLYHLEIRLSPLHIVAVTFTDAAANELRQRIRQRVVDAGTFPANVLSEIEAAPISTIHSLAARICREHPREAGVPADFQVLDDVEEALRIGDHFDAALDLLPVEIYTSLPYDLARPALAALLKDPLVAEAALAHGTEGWEQLAAAERRAALEDLTENSAWIRAAEVLTGTAGAAGDLIEVQRRIAAGALIQLRIGTSPREPLEVIGKLTLTGGRRGSWPAGDLDEVKAAIKVLRDNAKAALDAGLVTLEVGPADEQLRAMLPALRRAFAAVRAYAERDKRRARVLTFADLEVHATRALDHANVRAYYAARWQAFLVDEFQDTNPVQEKILTRLVGEHALITTVGDPNQSIYGFRRADSEVFERFKQRILARGGHEAPLHASRRTHLPLVETLNRVNEKLLGDNHQPLGATRQQPPHAGPHIEVYAVDQATPKADLDGQRWIEARNIACVLDKMLADKVLVHVRNAPDDCVRPIRPGDIAILARAWDTLDRYVDALGQCGIPAVLTGGGSLLETREAIDGIALLRFLADPTDDLALAAVLRGPFIAVSDRALYHFACNVPNNTAWWDALPNATDPDLARAHVILRDLLDARRTEGPSRLLQLANRATGYGAVIANLRNSKRREADWSGFVDFVRSREAGNKDVFAVVREIKRLIDAEVEVPRPPLEAGEAVTLTTIHGAKGMEWPVVVVPDLARRPPSIPPIAYADPDLGVALRFDDEEGVAQEPVLYTILHQRAQRREKAEARRILYVALTRARDRLILSAGNPSGGALDLLTDGLAHAGVAITTIPFDPAQAHPPDPLAPSPPPRPDLWLPDAVSIGLSAIPATGLSEYAQCPKRFRFHYVDGHPGAGEGDTSAREIGGLTHQALEVGARTVAELARSEPDLDPLLAEEAIKLAQRFRDHAIYAPIRDAAAEREVRVAHRTEGVLISGIVDRLSPSYLVDFKTDQVMRPEHHRLQVWAYARATRRPTAYVAYLRHDVVHRFDEADFRATDEQAAALARGIREGAYPASPSPDTCRWCPYAAICAERAEFR